MTKQILRALVMAGAITVMGTGIAAAANTVDPVAQASISRPEKAKDLASLRERFKNENLVDVTCEGTFFYRRPMWQRVLSFGILDEIADGKDKLSMPAIPGGTDIFRVLEERNPDLARLMGQMSKYTVHSSVFASRLQCTSSGKKPVTMVYQKHDDGKVDFSFED